MPLRDKRVLVVDDHQPMREILKSLLYGLGVRQVAEARDAAEAYELLSHSAYDMMFTDYEMGAETGVQLAQRLRGMEGHANRRIPIIMITGRTESSVIQAARNAGVDEYLVKPLTAAGLCRQVDATLSRRRPFIESPGYTGPDRRRSRDAYPGLERRQAPARQSA